MSIQGEATPSLSPPSEAQPPSPSLPPVASTSTQSAPEPDLVADELDKEYPSDPSVVTYRHLLSPQSLNFFPLKVIAHCDVDAAYAQFERVRLGLSPEQPVAVQQWSVLLAVNYQARALGIKRLMNHLEARKLCPELVIVHVASLKLGEGEANFKHRDNPSVKDHKISLEPYRRASDKIIKLFQRSVPEGEIEKASIDEAFLDLTIPIRNILLARYPYLAQPPSSSPLGLDTPLPPAPKLDWIVPGWGIPPPPLDSEGKQQASGWPDVALWLGGELMERVRGEVVAELGYTTSAGISHSKILAKVCSAYKKPSAQTILRTSAVSRFLRPMPFRKIRFLGGKLGIALENMFEVSTVEGLLSVSLEEMQSKFGEESIWVYNLLRGIDQSQVKAKSLPKSMLSTKDIFPALENLSEADPWLRLICAELIGRLQEARGETNESRGEADGIEGNDVWPKTLVLSWRDAEIHVGNIRYHHKSKQIPFPFHSPLSPTGPTLVLASRLLAEVFASGIRVTNLGLCFTGIERREEGQRGIEAFLRAGGGGGENETREKSRRREVELENAVAGPSTPTSPRKRSKKMEQQQLSKVKKEAEDASTSNSNGDASTSWTCPECSKVLPVPPPLCLYDNPSFELDRVRGEHLDWHVAKALQEETIGSSSFSTSPKIREGIGKPKKKAKTKTASSSGSGGLGAWLTKK